MLFFGAMLGLLAAPVASQDAKLPVVIIPGTGGNRLEAKLTNRPSVPHWYCSKSTSDWFDLWLDIKQLLPGVVDCWCENVKLLYDSSTDTFRNNDGVETRVPCYGDVCGFEYLDKSIKFGDSAYFHDLIDAFVSAGYTRGKDLVGAPYDFRYAASGNPDDYVANTVKMIESFEEPVLLVSHSMGGLWSHHLLSTQSQEWKDAHIAAWVPIAPAYGGTAKEMRLFASGDAEGIPSVSPSTVREEQRSYESNFWLLPNVDLWGADEVIVNTPEKTYSAHDLDQFFVDIGYPDGQQIYKRLKAIYDLSSPGVRTHVKYGTGKDTLETLTYSKTGDWDDIESTTSGDGDGTVNLRSLEAGKLMGWSDTEHKSFPGEDHTSVLKNKVLISELLELAGASEVEEVLKVA